MFGPMTDPSSSANSLLPSDDGTPTTVLLGPLNEFERRNAPERLYWLGDSELFRRRPRVSIVGARKASEDGLRRAARLARELVREGVTIVSGLAEGIDTAAHVSAIEASGRTIAVIGTPIDQTYPKHNAGLQRRIAVEQLLVSQFPKGYPVRRQNFPMRNRTMALMVDASVIVEASDSSGTLSQGWEALRLARTLFIMRSVVENRSLRWPAEMLDYGAQILEDSQDVVEGLPYGELSPALW